MGHSVGDAAARSVRKSEKVKPEDRTPEQILKGIRSNLAARLAVTPDDQRFLLLQYDTTVTSLQAANEVSKELTLQVENLTKQNNDQNQQIQKLVEENDQFRAVYEQENRKQLLSVETVPGALAEAVGDKPPIDSVEV
jgi:hypothetical protein